MTVASRLCRRFGMTWMAAASALIASPGASAAQISAGAGASVALCPHLSGTPFTDPTTVLVSSEFRPASAPQGAVPAPEHCEVIGKMQERLGANGQTYAIKFHLRMPTRWNGRLYFQGGGGTNGNVGDALGALPGRQPQTALNLGYAVISTDAGHDNAVNDDPKLQGTATFGWDAEARRNHGYASIGTTVRAGKALVAAFYGRAPAYTYFVGGSKGGQEAMMAVQRFPEEFDAALIGYPGFRLAHAAVVQVADAQAFAQAARAMGYVGPDGLPLAHKALSDEDIELTSAAILKACDGLDGLVDGMVENFTACNTAKVAPFLADIACKGDKTPACLLPVQITALREVYDGPRGKDGKALYSDWPWDPGIGVRTAAGVSQGWRIWKMGTYASDANNGNLIRLGAPSASAIFISPPVPVASDVPSLARYILTADVEATYAKTAVKWGAFNESAVDFMHADAIDLTPFTARGGKIIMFHGVSDPVFSINDSLRWYNEVNAREGGKAGRFIRFYAVPGMNHGRGGPATDEFDIFSPLVAWREAGVEPGPIVARAGAETPWPGRTRLLCAYPQQPRRVAGDSESAASFQCVAP